MIPKLTFQISQTFIILREAFQSKKQRNLGISPKWWWPPPPSRVGTFLNLGLYWNGLTPPLKSTWDFFELGIFLKRNDPLKKFRNKLNMKNIGTKSVNMSTTIDKMLCFWVLIRWNFKTNTTIHQIQFYCSTLCCHRSDCCHTWSNGKTFSWKTKSQVLKWPIVKWSIMKCMFVKRLLEKGLLNVNKLRMWSILWCWTLTKKCGKCGCNFTSKFIVYIHI